MTRLLHLIKRQRLLSTKKEHPKMLHHASPKAGILSAESVNVRLSVMEHAAIVIVLLKRYIITRVLSVFAKGVHHTSAASTLTLLYLYLIFIFILLTSTSLILFYFLASPYC